MAGDVVANIQTALAQTYAPRLARLWNRRVTLARSLKVKTSGMLGIGQNVAWDVEFNGATADTFGEGADVNLSSDTSFDAINKAKLDWGRYRSNFSLTFDEIDIAAANLGNANELEAIFEERVVGALTAIASKVNADLYSGTGTGTGGNPTIVGLDTALASTGSYAGLNKVTYPLWAGNESANGGSDRALTLALLSAAENQAFIASGFEPGMLMTTAAIHSKYESLFTALQRFPSDGRGPLPSFQGSTGELFWRGKPVMRDKDATSGNIYMLSTEEEDGLELCVLKPAGWSDQQRSLVGGAKGAPDEVLPIPIRVYRVPAAGSKVAFSIEVRCQLKVKRPNAHVLISDVLES